MIRSSGEPAFFATAAVFAVAVVSCGGDDTAAPPSDSTPEDPWGVMGQGGAVPIYGEETSPPEALRLRFKHLRVPDSIGATDIAFLPGAREVLLTLRLGQLYHLRLVGDQVEPISLWDFREEMLNQFACGPTNILLDRKFAENRFIYVSYCVDSEVTRIVRYHYSRSDGPVEPAVIFETVVDNPEEESEWHRVGSMGWEDDETMWFLLGDHRKQDLAQDVTTPFGGVHRIIPNRDPRGSGFTPASGNMADAIGEVGGREPFPSLFAFGLRSPWRGTRDRQGRFFIGDVGLEWAEEVNFLSEVGQNFGWDEYEGPCDFSCAGLTDPIVYYEHDDVHPYVLDDPKSRMTNLRAVWVGEIYQDPSIDRYNGLMDDVVPIGDVFSGWVRGLKVSTSGDVIHNKWIGHIEDISQWRVGPDGYCYAIDLHGQIHVALLDGD